MDDKFVYLMTADSEIDAKIIESKLIYYDIPVVLEHQGAGAFLSIITGSWAGAMDIFVPGDRIDDARELMDIKEAP
jgi:hypothetical protein